MAGRSIPATPRIVWKRPTVLLDSGQSVGESVFLERLRLWIHQSIKAHAKQFNVPAVWIMVPNERHMAYHGAYPVGEFDKWEIRPIRWRNRPLDKQGFMASAALFEEGCFRKKIKAPWREHNSKNLRATLVYLKPTLRDLMWAVNKRDTFRNAFNCPEFILGEPSGWTMPRQAHEWVSGVWTWTRGKAQTFAKSYWPTFGFPLPWWKWWTDDRESGRERPEFGVAEAFGDHQTMRHPGIAYRWIMMMDGEVDRPEKPDTWQGLMQATWCKFYIVATTREAVPFDAMIAAARGATLIAPDTPAFRKIPGKHWLYPVQDAGDSVLWNQTDVGTLILGRYRRHGNASTTNH